MNIIPISTNEPEKGSMLDYALKYATLGWYVFPVWGAKEGKCKCRRMCKSPAKHPVEHLVPQGQDNATTDPVTIRRWWAQMPDAGIAVFLKPSGLCAIDIDPRNGGFLTIEALEARHGNLVSDVMQYTQGGGEHRVFKLTGDLQLPGKLGPGVDVKRNGYIVLAPTRGISGIYDWEGSSDPLEGSIPSPLPDWIRDIGSPTQQIELIPATTRIVVKEQIEELRDALSHLPADDRDTWIKYGLALHSLGQEGFDLWVEWSKKSPKFDPVDQIRVWRGFKPGSVNFESIFFDAQQAGWVNPLSGNVTIPNAVPVEHVKPLPKQKTIETPAHLLAPPGILGRVAQWIGATSRKPQPQFDVQAAIAFCATIMGRRYCTDQNNWPSLYLLNIGKSACGKEHAMWAVEHLLDACGMDHLVGPASYTSNSGVLSALNKQPSHITIIDEFGKVLEAASIKNSARAASAMTTLMEVWARCDGTMRPQGYSTFGMSSKDAERMEDRSVRNPALTLLALTTPETFFNTIGSAAARDGFLNRFLIVESDIGRQVGKSSKRMPVPEIVTEWAKQTHIHDGLANPDISATLAAVPKMIRILPEANKLFNAFEHECIANMDAYDESGLAEMFGRCNEIAMRLSLIVAVSCDWSSINAEHAQWAIDYVRHYTSRTVDRLVTSVADSEFEAVKKQVFAFVKEAGSNGLAEWELEKKSVKFRCLDKRGQVSVLDSLAFVSKIQRVKISKSRGPARVAWVAIDPESENQPKPPDDCSGGITQ